MVELPPKTLPDYRPVEGATFRGGPGGLPMKIESADANAAQLVVEMTSARYTFDYLLADIGIDDEVTAARAHSGFKVLGDGVPLYDSGLMTAVSETKSIKVCIRGVKTLTLHVYRGLHTKLDGHADWAEARLVGSRARVSAVVE